MLGFIRRGLGFPDLQRGIEIATNVITHLQRFPHGAAYRTYGVIYVAVMSGVAVTASLGLYFYNEYQKAKPLFLAAQTGNLIEVERLLQAQNMKQRAHLFFNYALRQAATHGHTAVVHRLLEEPAVRANAAAFGNQAFHQAAINGHFEVVRTLLKLPVVVGAITGHDYFTLRKAAKNGHLGVVRELLALGGIRDVMKEFLEFGYFDRPSDTELIKTLAKTPGHGLLSAALCEESQNSLIALLALIKSELSTSEQPGSLDVISEIVPFLPGFEDATMLRRFNIVSNLEKAVHASATSAASAPRVEDRP